MLKILRSIEFAKQPEEDVVRISGDSRAGRDRSKLDGSELDGGKIDDGKVEDDKVEKKVQKTIKSKNLSKSKKK